MSEEFGGDPPMTPDEMKEHEISHVAEKFARQLEREYGAQAAVKLLAYAIDTIQPGLYQPSDAEREEFMQDPAPGQTKGLSGKIDFDLSEVFSKKQRRWACAQEGPEFEEMCSGPMKKEGKKASKSVGDPPYRERGSTESQAQQMAAGAALSARRGDTPVSKLKGASKDLYSGEISTKDLRNLAKLGQKVKGHKSKEPKHRKSLPGHATPAKD